MDQHRNRFRLDSSLLTIQHLSVLAHRAKLGLNRQFRLWIVHQYNPDVDWPGLFGHFH